MQRRVRATSKSNAREVNKILTRWGKMRYAKAFGSWEEQTKDNRKLPVLATKVVKRWEKKALALAWDICCLISPLYSYR